MKTNPTLMIVPFLSLFVCSHPSSPIDTTLDASAHGRTIYYPLNQKFTVQLDLQADAGYQWYCFISDSNIVRVDSASYSPKTGNPNQVGGVTVETLFFCTANIGQSEVALFERRPWESYPGIDSLRFTVKVTA